jgi:hypothetical protein
MNLPVNLTKSAFLRGLQCVKALYLERFEPELAQPPDPEAKARMAAGQQVGKLAHELFPGGISCAPDTPFKTSDALARTQQALDGGAAILYEPTFIIDDLQIRADILVRRERKWQLYEVKSGTSMKKHHLWDVAFQVFVLRQAGIELLGAWLTLLDSEYVRQGELDLGLLFTHQAIDGLIQEYLDQIPAQIEMIQGALRSGAIPQVAIGAHCYDPVECPFHDVCWKDIPRLSVFDVYRLPWPKKEALFAMGVVKIEEIPEGYDLPQPSWFHVSAHKKGESIVERQPLRRFLKGLAYPLAFLDFETFMPAIPLYDQSRPYQQIPFQYSLHVIEAPGTQASHIGFLAVAGPDPRAEFIESLLMSLPEVGDVLVYYLPFEGTRLMELARDFPARAEALNGIIERLKDLMIPFQKRWVYEPAMNGSLSIKAVLPALVPEMSYDTLEIRQGGEAMQAFERLVSQPDDPQEASIRQALWDYCTQDTLAMVKILERLSQIAS